MEAETESDPAVNPSFQSPLTIALGIAGKGASIEEPAVAFGAKSWAKTGSELPEGPNDPRDSKAHLEHVQEDQRGISAQVETLVSDESNLASYVFKPVSHGETPVGVAIGLAKTSIDGLAWYVKTTFAKEGDERGCFSVMGQVGENTSRSGRIAYMVAQQTLLEKQPENTFFKGAKLCSVFPAANGSSAGCTLTTSLLSLAMNKRVRKGLAMTGEITTTGLILLVGGVKEKTIGARRSQVKTIIFPEANRREFDELPENMKEGLDVHFVDEYDQIFELAFNYEPSEDDQTSKI